jgi:hypothetical protein
MIRPLGIPLLRPSKPKAATRRCGTHRRDWSQCGKLPFPIAQEDQRDLVAKRLLYPPEAELRLKRSLEVDL